MTQWAVLNSNNVVLDTFLFNTEDQNDVLHKIDEYDKKYPNQVQRLINSDGKSVLPCMPGWIYVPSEDRFYDPNLNINDEETNLLDEATALDSSDE